MERRQLTMPIRQIYKFAQDKMGFECSLTTFKRAINRSIFKKYDPTARLSCQSCANRDFLADSLKIEPDTLMSRIKEHTKKLNLGQLGQFMYLYNKNDSECVLTYQAVKEEIQTFMNNTNQQVFHLKSVQKESEGTVVIGQTFGFQQFLELALVRIFGSLHTHDANNNKRKFSGLWMPLTRIS